MFEHLQNHYARLWKWVSASFSFRIYSLLISFFYNLMFQSRLNCFPLSHCFPLLITRIIILLFFLSLSFFSLSFQVLLIVSPSSTLLLFPSLFPPHSTMLFIIFRSPIPFHVLLVFSLGFSHSAPPVTLVLLSFSYFLQLFLFFFSHFLPIVVSFSSSPSSCSLLIHRHFPSPPPVSCSCPSLTFIFLLLSCLSLLSFIHLYSHFSPFCLLVFFSFSFHLCSYDFFLYFSFVFLIFSSFSSFPPEFLEVCISVLRFLCFLLSLPFRW